MLFFLNLDGTVTRSDTDHVYQGQNKVANVELFTLISPAQAAIQVAFTLPNGLTSAYMPMSYVGAYSVDESNQKQVHRWKLAVPYNVTEAEGQVGVSFNVLLNDGTSGQTQETINQTTYTSSFTVEYSALPIPPTTATESELEQLLTLLNLYYTQNASLAKQKPFVVGEVTTETLETNEPAQVVVEQSAVADSNGNYPTNFAFSIPKGATGATGPQGATGAQGPQGEAGADGINVWITYYETGAVFINDTIVVSTLDERAKANDGMIVIWKGPVFNIDTTGIAIGTIVNVSDRTVRITGNVNTMGKQGPQGEAGNAMYIYNGLLDASVTDVQVAQITIPTGRTLQAEDILISSYESSIGAMAQVVSISDGVATVDFIGQISAGGSGGTTLNKYTVSAPSINLIRKIVQNVQGRYEGVFAMNLDDVGPFQISINSLAFLEDGEIKIRTVLDRGLGQFYYLVSSVIVASSETITVGALKIDYNTPTFTKIDAPVYRKSSTYIIYYNDTEITI